MKCTLFSFNKKYLLGLLVLLIPTICPAQSAESNNYYRKGIEYVSSEDYINAISAFKMCQQTDTAQTPSFNLSHNWRNWVGYCYYKIGETDSAKHYTEFYRYKPYNRFEIQGLDSIYWKSAVLYNEKKNEESLHYLNEVEQRLLSIYGPSNMYLNIIWRNQALLLYPYNRPKAINILTKVWHNYADSLGYCKTWKEAGDELLSYYMDSGKRDSTLQAYFLDEPLDSNMVVLKNTNTNKVGLIQMSDMTLILPMEYNSISKINDRFLLVNADYRKDLSFFVDLATGKHSQLFSGVFYGVKYICESNGIPIFHGFKEFIDFNGKVTDCPISFNGISDDKAYFDIDSVTFCVHKDSLSTAINTIRNVFPEKEIGTYGDYQVLSILNNNYAVIYKNNNTGIVGLLNITKNKIEEIIPCECDKITSFYDENHFFIVKGNNNYILDLTKKKLTELKGIVDDTDGYWEYIEYKGKKYAYCGEYRKMLIDLDGNVYHLPIGMSIEKSDDGYYCCHYKENVRIPLSDMPLGKTSEYRKKDIRNWRISIRMDWPKDNSKLSQNIRNWMSETLVGNLPLWMGDGYIYNANEAYTPLEMYKYYANKTTEYFFREDDPDFRASLTDCDIYKMWEDENYITYIAGYTWYYGGAHGAENIQLVTFDKKSQKKIKAIDLFNKNKRLSKELQNILFDKISKEIYKRSKGNEDFEFTQENIPIGNVALTPQGIAFQYDNYVLASFAMGAIDIIIPYDELTDICIVLPMSSSAKSVFVESIKQANTFSEIFFLSEQQPTIHTIEQCTILKNKFGENSGEYLNSLILLSDYQLANGKLEIAASLAKEYAQSIKTQVGADSKAYRLAIESLIKCCLAAKKYEEAKYYSLELLRLCQNEYYMNESISTTEFSNVYLSLADAYWNVNKPDSALYYQKQHLQLNKYPDIEHIMDACEYANACYQQQEAINYAQQVFTYHWNDSKNTELSWQSKILNRFKELDSPNRTLYRNKYIPWFQTFLPELAEISGDSVIINNAYDALLLSKNLLLNIEHSIRNMILSSQDTTIIKPYLELQNLKKELLIIANMKNISDEQKEGMMNNISNNMQRLESELSEKSKVYGDYTKQLQIGINDVRRNLYSDEIAVEFANSSDSIYYALILNPKKELPTIIKLCSSTELREHPDNIYQLIWKPILAIEDNVKSIYFSPAGELYNLPIEYASNANGQYINENYGIYRLSSTREIVLSRDSLFTSSPASNNNAVLYGYLDYYADNIYSNENGKHVSQDNTYSIKTDFKRAGSLRSNVERLKYTEKEISEIDSLLEISQYAKVDTIYKNEAGTESSLKSYSGSHIKLLHLATHGFYISKSEMDRFTDLNFLSVDSINIDRIEDKELIRSGLLFAGANHTLEGDRNMPDGVDDGILTSLEVASLDLMGLDLVVLSACQTAQGDLAEDGVMGLQRGFKKAGAHSLLMSLWKVDDEATQILMTQFYKNLVFGHNKRESLISAQRYLREYKNTNGEQCYNSPEYWAAFILLDGIK